MELGEVVSVVGSSAIGTAGAGLVWAVFRIFESRWPSAYFAIDDLTAQRVSVSPFRYLLFRLGPVTFVSAACVSVALNAETSEWVAVATLWGFHVFTSIGHRMRDLVRGPSRFGRRLEIAINVGLSGATGLAALAGVPLGRQEWFADLVPTVEELRSDLWTALFAAALTVGILRLLQGQWEVTAAQLVERSRRTLPGSMVRLARELAEEGERDPDLVEAILLVENLQRPRWLRFLEHRLGRFLGVKTYGVMQVQSEIPVSDEESIRIAIRDHIPQLSPDQVPFQAAYAYNGDGYFVEMVEAVYFHLRGR